MKKLTKFKVGDCLWNSTHSIKFKIEEIDNDYYHLILYNSYKTSEPSNIISLEISFVDKNLILSISETLKKL